MTEEESTVSRKFCSWVSANRSDASRRRALRWMQLCVTGFVSIVIVVVMWCDWSSPLPATYLGSERSYPPAMNTTHINGKPMERVVTNYTNNIFFTVKTSMKNYRKRLTLLMLTWFQVVDKNKVCSAPGLAMCHALCTIAMYPLNVSIYIPAT